MSSHGATFFTVKEPLNHSGEKGGTIQKKKKKTKSAWDRLLQIILMDKEIPCWVERGEELYFQQVLIGNQLLNRHINFQIR